MAAKKTKRAEERGRGSAPAGRRQKRDDGHGEEKGHEHVEFVLSKATSEVIDAALKGLTGPQRGRVMAAVDCVGAEAAEKAGRWVEQNVVANANALFAAIAPALARESRWAELGAIRQFLVHFDVPVSDDRVARTIERLEGAGAAGEYRKSVVRSK